MKINFTLWNIIIQDGNCNELVVGEIFDGCYFELTHLTNIKKLHNDSKHYFKNINKAHYEIVGNVYRITDWTIFIDINGVKLNINKEDNYNIDTLGCYSLNAHLNYDIWNNYGLSDDENTNYDNELYLCGVIKSISVNNINIKKTNSWDDEDKYGSGKSLNYLIELEILEKNMRNKKTKIYAQTLEDTALKQFNNAMNIERNIQGALMPDAHTGYTLPIGAVIKSKSTIFPAYVGYDIGCGMCAVKLDISKEEIDLDKLKKYIINNIPLGVKKHNIAQDYKISDATNFAKDKFEEVGKYQIGTLGGGNHFIELGTGRDEKVWIVIHSGSRGFGAKIAEHYMRLAALQYVDKSEYEEEFESKNQDFKLHNLSRYNKVKTTYVNNIVEKYLKSNTEGHFGFDINSNEGQEYILDMNCALQYGLANRKAMINKITSFLQNPKELMFINRNHNHAELVDDNCVIHRKGATHAKLGMYGVIPGNMKDGSFIVKGKGCKDSLESSSHGAGRILSRKQAKLNLNLDEFHNEMKGIKTNHSDKTLDESPKAYKNIFEVMQLQKDLVDVVDHIKPFLNIKG